MIKLITGNIVRHINTGKIGKLADIQYVHDRYKIKNISGWKDRIDLLEVVTTQELIDIANQSDMLIDTLKRIDYQTAGLSDLFAREANADVRWALELIN